MGKNDDRAKAYQTRILLMTARSVSSGDVSCAANRKRKTKKKKKKKFESTQGDNVPCTWTR